MVLKAEGQGQCDAPQSRLGMPAIQGRPGPDQEAMPTAEALPPSLSLLTAAGGSGSPGLQRAAVPGRDTTRSGSEAKIQLWRLVKA